MLKLPRQPLADFETVHGKVRQLYGCSLASLAEFLERVDDLRAAVLAAEGTQSLEQLLTSNNMLAASVARCLELHGISSSDVGLRQVAQLLLYDIVDGDVQPGLLVRLSLPRDAAQVAEADAQPLLYEHAVAVLATYTNSVAEAVELTHSMTLAQISKLSDELHKVAQPPDSKSATLRSEQLLAQLAQVEAL